MTSRWLRTTAIGLMASVALAACSRSGGQVFSYETVRGWDARWSSTAGGYMNERNGVKHFPGISVEAAKFLAGDRLVVGIGIDTPSIDYGSGAPARVFAVFPR